MVTALALAWPVAGLANSAEPAWANRCGWFDNPSPGNATLTDGQGVWDIAVQGGHQAKGNWPKFKGAQWVRTGHGSAGYGCACLSVKTKDDAITHIASSRSLPLASCRKDKALVGQEPQNPLK